MTREALEAIRAGAYGVLVREFCGGDALYMARDVVELDGVEHLRTFNLGGSGVGPTIPVTQLEAQEQTFKPHPAGDRDSVVRDEHGGIIGWVTEGGCEHPRCLEALEEGLLFHAIPRGFACTLEEYHYATREEAERVLREVMSKRYAYVQVEDVDGVSEPGGTDEEVRVVVLEVERDPHTDLADVAVVQLPDGSTERVRAGLLREVG